jgi:membrane protein required for colicin V production
VAQKTGDEAGFPRYILARSADSVIFGRHIQESRSGMPFSVLDIALIGVMLISGVLAMVRGFMREVLSIASWGLAALVTLSAYSKAVPIAKQYISNEMIATGAAVGALFLGTLLVVSLFTVKISDMILDSRVGALDRSLGFLFGLARGLVIMVVAYLFLVWLVPSKSQPSWVADARSKPVLQGTGDWILSLLPDDPEGTILKRLKRPKDGGGGDDTTPPADAPAVPGQRSNIGNPARMAGGGTAESSYKRGDRQGFDQLLESTSGSPR